MDSFYFSLLLSLVEYFWVRITCFYLLRLLQYSIVTYLCYPLPTSRRYPHSGARGACLLA